MFPGLRGSALRLETFTLCTIPVIGRMPRIEPELMRPQPGATNELHTSLVLFLPQLKRITSSRKFGRIIRTLFVNLYRPDMTAGYRYPADTGVHCSVIEKSESYRYIFSEKNTS